MRVALYARVSTLDKGQDTEVQLRELRAYAARRGWTAVEYVDIGVSGTKDSRPQLNAMMQAAKRGKLDCVLVARFDRFARSVSHLLRALEEFRALGIDFVSLNEACDTTTPQGKMLFTILGAVAEFERALICERVRAGLAHARANGRVPGPKPVTLDIVSVTRRRNSGESWRAIASSLGVSPALLVKRTKALQQTA
ncbi:MAG TPA: recombinase family protein [Candidatus Sulfotelmatobacter sp.]|nr:recombinase family protein [Candidatus Sulfotelmatobacter sp.]